MAEKNYEEDVAAMMDILGRLYFHMAHEMLGLGAEGEAALRRAVRNYGKDRAQRLRKLHEARGLPICLWSLFQAYDLPGADTSRFRRDVVQLDETARVSLVYECQFCNVWKELGGDEALRSLGQIYCHEFHPAMWNAYDPRITVDLPKLLTMGDEYCDTQAHSKPWEEGTKEEA
jgi:hypothetical protein